MHYENVYELMPDLPAQRVVYVAISEVRLLSVKSGHMFRKYILAVSDANVWNEILREPARYDRII